MKNINVKIKKLVPEATIPKYAFKTDAGCDVIATSRKITHNFIEYGTGIAFDIPEGYYIEIFPRSSISKYNLLLCNSVGIIDEQYKGEIKFRFKRIMHEGNLFKDFENIYNIGDKIGQIILKQRPKINFIEVDELTESDRGASGYGSTGN